jgi:hypothetical protein
VEARTGCSESESRQALAARMAAIV